MENKNSTDKNLGVLNSAEVYNYELDYIPHYNMIFKLYEMGKLIETRKRSGF